MLTNNLPCIHIQDEAIMEALNAYMTVEDNDPNSTLQVARCVQVGDLYDRTWKLEGELANVTFFDQGNGWACIEDVDPPSPEAYHQFVENLWDHILNKAEMRNHYRDRLERHVAYNNRPDDCECATRLNAVAAA